MQLVRVCMRYFIFCYNVSRNFLFHKRMDENCRVRSLGQRNTRFRQANSAKYSSIYAWLSRFARFFEVEPGRDRVNLPFSDKQQVYTLYMLDVKAENRKCSTSPSLFNTLICHPSFFARASDDDLPQIAIVWNCVVERKLPLFLPSVATGR